MSRPKPFRRGRHAQLRSCRRGIEQLEGRLLLSGTHQTALLSAIDSALQSSNLSGLGAWTAKLKDASALGRNLPLIGSVLSNINLNSGVSLAATESSLSALVSDLQQSANHAVVTASRDLPDDVQIDFQHTFSANISGPVGADFGIPLTLPGSIAATVSVSETLTVGAYWDATASAAVFYVDSSNAQLQATITASATLNPTGATLGFVTLGIDGATASMSASAAISLNTQPPVNASEPAGRLTLGQLNSTAISSLVNTKFSASGPTTLALQFHSSLISGSHNMSFSWPDINDATNVTSTLATDPTLAALKSLQSVSADSFSSGIDLLTGELESLASTSISNLGIVQKKLPLVSESIASAVNFQQFFKTNLSNRTDEVPNASGILTSPFQNADQLLNLLKTIPGSVVSETSNAGQVLYTLAFNKNISTSMPLSLNLGSALNLNVTSSLNFNVGVAVNVEFGVDGSTGQFFVVANNQPAVQLTPSLIATVNGSASLGFLSINVNNGTLSGCGSGSITLVDPQTDSPATPGIITASELASSNLSSLFNLSFSGSASASLPLSTTVPGVSPATLTMSWPDLTDPSTVNTGALSQFMGFNGLSTQTVLGYLENLPTLLKNITGPSALGKSIGLLGSSVGNAVALGDKLESFLSPLKNDNINTVQDLQTFLTQELSAVGSSLALNVSSTDIDFSFDYGQTYSGSSSWSLGQSIGPSGFLSLQTSGSLPMTASFDAKLEVGISLSDLSDPLDDFYVIEGPNS